VLTLNLFARHGDWPARREALRAGFAQLRPDLVTLQEAVTDADGDTAAEVLGPEYVVVHQRLGLIGDGSHHGASVASRWPVNQVHEVDLHLTPRTGDYSCGAVIIEVGAPEPVGPMLVASHGDSWAWWAEHERELQALALVRRIEELVSVRPAHVVIGGDFNSVPDASSMRFFAGRQSLHGVSTAYQDCWESVHGDRPGCTFDTSNPLTRIDEPDLGRGRRIDYLLVRCGDHGPTLRIDDCRLVFDRPIDGTFASDHFGVLADLRHSPESQPVPGRRATSDS
jgi:endonuclease/exonuclease/phosphatase family metal-dependent hydrolase